MKKEIPVAELQFGMYVAQLDRPWTETPFMFQGFELKSDQELEALKKYCKTVFIETEKGLDLPDRSQIKPGPAAPAKPGASVLTEIKSKTRYEERASVDVEMPRARAPR